MPEFNLLRALPNTKRNIRKRSDAKDASVVAIAKQFGEMYFDGPREYGYGGYRYDGRWRPVARILSPISVLSRGCVSSTWAAPRAFSSKT